jgi:molybdopterin molybdotransferase/putative molybdopterin biosynthesis protein
LAITNKLASARKQKGVSASALATSLGVSRQMIYAVEAGTYIPNTAVALRLAQALGVTMDDLFSLVESSPIQSSSSKRVTLLATGEQLQPGQGVQLCNVGGKLVAAASAPVPWYLPVSDAAIAAPVPVSGKALVTLHRPESDFGNRLLLAGCDPAMSLLTPYLQSAGIRLVLVHQNSSQSLSLIKRGYAHIAGSHLRDSAGTSNIGAVNRLFPSKSAALISFAIWQEGIITKTGNPKQIKSVCDLARKDVTFVNREAGAGTRMLLDSELKRAGLKPETIASYSRTAPGHVAAAWEVKTGRVDCCLATEAAARFFGLTFIPLVAARYDFVIRKQQLTTPSVQVLLNVINQAAFRRELNNVGGYDTSVTGERVQ